jgi:gliding motility-associated lipoprotein GldD
MVSFHLRRSILLHKASFMRVIFGYFLWCLTVIIASCEDTYPPKPKGYPRIDLPDTAYVQLNDEHPFTFYHSVHARVTPDTTRLTEPHWLDIYYPAFDATVQITYKALNNDPKHLPELVEDARKLLNKHQIKASGIQEIEVRTKRGHHAYLFRLTGQVPTQFQFYTTDSSHHFLRGALYFNTSTQNDSLAPIIDYITGDMVKLINTLDWKYPSKK